MGRNLSARNFAPAKREKKSWQSGARVIQPSAARLLPLRNMVVTPASVPEFTIPALCPARLQGGAHGQRRRHTIPRSTDSSSSSIVRALTRCCPFSDEHELGFIDHHELQTLSDPTTRAAMSLPHLSKITTPYGFLTLGESPCVRRRESLFFEEKNGLQECSQAEHEPCLTTRDHVKSKSNSYCSFSHVRIVKTERERDSEKQKYSGDYSNLTLARPAHINCGFLRKALRKCLPKVPWSR